MEVHWNGLDDAPPRHFRVKWLLQETQIPVPARGHGHPPRHTPGLHHTHLQGLTAMADELHRFQSGLDPRPFRVND